jgi:hypothetical protein
MSQVPSVQKICDQGGRGFASMYFERTKKFVNVYFLLSCV